MPLTTTLALTYGSLGFLLARKLLSPPQCDVPDAAMASPGSPLPQGSTRARRAQTMVGPDQTTTPELQNSAAKPQAPPHTIAPAPPAAPRSSDPSTMDPAPQRTGAAPEQPASQSSVLTDQAAAPQPCIATHTATAPDPAIAFDDASLNDANLDDVSLDGASPGDGRFDEAAPESEPATVCTALVPAGDLALAPAVRDQAERQVRSARAAAQAIMHNARLQAAEILAKACAQALRMDVEARGEHHAIERVRAHQGARLDGRRRGGDRALEKLLEQLEHIFVVGLLDERPA